MIIGHIGVAFAARWRWPKAPLPWLLIATMAPDLWRGILAASGLNARETNLYSHELPWGALLAVFLAGAALLALRDLESTFVVGALVLSHIALDMVSGWKALWPGGPNGLELEHFEQLEFLVEVALAWVGLAMLKRSSAPRWIVGWPMFAVLVAIEGAYLAASYEARPWKTRCVAYPLAPCWTHL